jgi:hypothetical protein
MQGAQAARVSFMPGGVSKKLLSPRRSVSVPLQASRDVPYCVARPASRDTIHGTLSAIAFLNTASPLNGARARRMLHE